MRSLARFGWPAIALVLGACAGPTPSSSAASATASATAGMRSTQQATANSPVASPAAAAGRPYDAADVLAAMQASRRPGGVPDALQTEPIADRLARAMWTYGGARWPTMAVSGSCGPQTCSIDLSGTPDGAAGEDLYTFSVTPADVRVELLVADLHGYPSALDATLDGLARRELDADRLNGLALAAARWLPPPKSGQFMLSYRSGGEEGSPALDVQVDLPAGRVLEAKPPTT